MYFTHLSITVPSSIRAQRSARQKWVHFLLVRPEWRGHFWETQVKMSASIDSFLLSPQSQGFVLLDWDGLFIHSSWAEFGSQIFCLAWRRFQKISCRNPYSWFRLKNQTTWQHLAQTPAEKWLSSLGRGCTLPTTTVPTPPWCLPNAYSTSLVYVSFLAPGGIWVWDP